MMTDPNYELYNQLAEALGRTKVKSDDASNLPAIAWAAMWETANGLIDWSANFDVVLDTYPGVNDVYTKSLDGWDSQEQEDKFWEAVKPIVEFEDELYTAQCVMNAFLALEGFSFIQRSEYDSGDSTFSDSNLEKTNRAFEDYRAKLQDEFKAKQ